LSDIYFGDVNYDKFILFDKLGVMKMVAKVSKEANILTITNASKNKPYTKEQNEYRDRDKNQCRDK